MTYRIVSGTQHEGVTFVSDPIADRGEAEFQADLSDCPDLPRSYWLDIETVDEATGAVVDRERFFG